MTDSKRPPGCTHATVYPLCRCAAPDAPRKIATTVYVSPAQHEALRALSARLDLPIARIIRGAIDRELAANAVKP